MIAQVENNIVVKWPLGEQYIRTVFPHISFPRVLSDDVLQKYGFARFEYSGRPEYDAEFQEAKEITPILNGVVATQQWEIVEKYTPEEKAKYIAKRDAEHLEAQKTFVRAERNRKLADTDWTQVADSPVDQTAWATYRQALRDVPAQAGFPWEVTWPTQPE